MIESNWTADRITDLSGRTFVVTGANSGLGLATTKQLARRGAHVVLAVRNEAKGHRAVAEISGAWPGPSLEVRRLDLADLDSVQAFADGVHADGLRVDVLVNNAGLMAPPRTLSPQGYEVQFAAHHLGHFALTGLLLDLLQRGQDPRVVTVTSALHRGARIQFDDLLTGERTYSPVRFYRQSKFANVLFALELDRRLRAAGSPVRSLLAHAGYTATNLKATGATAAFRMLTAITHVLMAQDVAMGALPQLYAATAPNVQSGQFFGPDGFRELRGHPKLVRPDPAAEDADTERRLWDLSEELTGVRYAAITTIR